MYSGMIQKGIGGFYYVKSGDQIFQCRARGKFRKDSITPLVGDRVEFSADSPEDGYILSILARKNSLIRPPMANLDQLFIVIAAKDPQPDLTMVDKITAICELKEIEPVIVINKSDLSCPNNIKDIYLQSGFSVIVTSAKTGLGIDEIYKMLLGKLSAFCGQSGVGKSSMFNFICPDCQMKVGDISGKISRGRHTTRHIELVSLGENTYIADTPGFSSLDIVNSEVIKKQDLPYAFREFAPYLGQCAFRDCSHTCEKGCAVLAAWQKGLIAQSRLDSYMEFYEEVKNLKDWEN